MNLLCIYLKRMGTIDRLKLLFQRIPLSYCFEQSTRFDSKAFFAWGPVSRLIKPGDITKEFE